MTKTDRQTAVEYIKARDYHGLGELYVYYADETQSHWLVKASDLDALGSYLDDGKPDAYSRWCSDYSGLELSDDYESRLSVAADGTAVLAGEGTVYGNVSDPDAEGIVGS